MWSCTFLKFEEESLLFDIEIDQAFYPTYDSGIELQF